MVQGQDFSTNCRSSSMASQAEYGWFIFGLTPLIYSKYIGRLCEIRIRNSLRVLWWRKTSWVNLRDLRSNSTVCVSFQFLGCWSIERNNHLKCSERIKKIVWSIFVSQLFLHCDFISWILKSFRNATPGLSPRLSAWEIVGQIATLSEFTTS